MEMISDHVVLKNVQEMQNPGDFLHLPVLWAPVASAWWVVSLSCFYLCEVSTTGLRDCDTHCSLKLQLHLLFLPAPPASWDG